MSTVLCPTNCEEHDYMFPHSVITTERVIKRERTVIEFIICRACEHWISNHAVKCSCRFHCHEEKDGMLVLVQPA